MYLEEKEINTEYIFRRKGNKSLMYLEDKEGNNECILKKVNE